jgi:hypothetical protein
LPEDFKTTKPILLDSLHITAAMYIYSESKAILAWSFLIAFACSRKSKTTKPILLDSLHITAAIYIVNQAILAWSFNILCCRQMLRADQADIA